MILQWGNVIDRSERFDFMDLAADGLGHCSRVALRPDQEECPRLCASVAGVNDRRWFAIHAVLSRVANDSFDFSRRKRCTNLQMMADGIRTFEERRGESPI